jgi:hypothetical protein
LAADEIGRTNEILIKGAVTAVYILALHVEQQSCFSPGGTFITKESVFVGWVTEGSPVF